MVLFLNYLWTGDKPIELLKNKAVLIDANMLPGLKTTESRVFNKWVSEWMNNI